MNLFNALLAIPQEGTNKAIIKYLSPEEQPLVSSYQYLVGGFIINITAFIFLSIYLFLNDDTFFRLFAFGNSQLAWGSIFLTCVLCYTFNTFFLSFLQIQQNFKTYAILNTLGNLFGLLAIALFITQNQEWILLALPIGLGFALLPTIIFTFPIIRQFFSPVQWSWQASKGHLKDMAGFVLMALSVLLFEYITSFAMREYSIQYFNSENTGYWQAVSTLSGYYMAAFSAVVISVYYPQVASKINRPTDLKQYVRSIVLFLIPLIIVGLCTVFFLRSWLLELLFTTGFEESSSLFRYQLIGDFFKMIAFLFGALLLAQGRLTTFIILQGVSAMVYISTIPIISETWQLEAFPFAHCLRNLIYCSLLVISCRKTILGQASS